jgi:SH3-like domain-containing protein
LNNALSLGGIFRTMVSDALEIPDDGRVNVRSDPGTGSSTVLFTLNPGDIIDVIAATNETETLSGISDRWFQISDPNGQTGWVFGSYIGD